MPKKTNPRTSIKAGDRVEVEWEDAYNSGGWVSNIEDHTPAIVHTVGFVVFNDKRGIKLATGRSKNLNDSYDALGQSFVPQGMVRKIRKI